MTTYLFMLTPETERILVQRVLGELEKQFPEHEFVAGGADIPEFENSILPLRGMAGDFEEPGSVVIPDETEVQHVSDAFAAILEGAQDWKPS